MDVRTFLEFAPLFVALVWAAMVDLRTRRIPNWLTLGLLTAGLVRPFMPGAPIAIDDASLGALAGLGLILPLFVLKAVGGGDVKLLAAVGAWLGPLGVLAVFVIEALVGAAFAIAQAVTQGRTAAVLRNTALITLNLAHVREVGVDHVAHTGHATQAPHEKLHMPWAIPLSIAVIFVAIGKWLAAN